MTIVAAFAERAGGPGWRNSLIWVVGYDDLGGLRLWAIQPEDQTPEMMVLFNVCVAATETLTAHVRTTVARGDVVLS